MAKTYELWDTETRNRVAVFNSRSEALAAVRHTLATQGRALAETLLLGTEDDEGESEVVARGAGLIAVAVSESPKPVPTSRRVVSSHGPYRAANGTAAPRSGQWTKRDSTASQSKHIPSEGHTRPKNIGKKREK